MKSCPKKSLLSDNRWSSMQRQSRCRLVGFLRTFRCEIATLKHEKNNLKLTFHLILRQDNGAPQGEDIWNSAKTLVHEPGGDSTYWHLCEGQPSSDLHIAQLFSLRQTLLEPRPWHAADGTGETPPPFPPPTQQNLNPRRLVRFWWNASQPRAGLTTIHCASISLKALSWSPAFCRR